MGDYFLNTQTLCRYNPEIQTGISANGADTLFEICMDVSILFHGSLRNARKIDGIKFLGEEPYIWKWVDSRYYQFDDDPNTP